VPELLIEAATPDDLARIRAAYADARARQLAMGSFSWPEFGDAWILAQIEAGVMYRVLRGDALAGVFTIAYEDPALWGDRECGEHVYLHRIARAESFTERGLVAAIVAWARAHSRAIGRRGLRMDTWARSEALIAFYQRFGFELVARTVIGADPRLEPHYHGLELALLEERVEPRP
jgi:RimJ/RimL family protein N-acetyltransferase